MNTFEPRLCHENQGYGDFLPCPFCGKIPRFSISFTEWHDKAGNCSKESDTDDVPDDPAGCTVSVGCSSCCISMSSPRDVPAGYEAMTKKQLLESDNYKDKFDDLLWRWNRRQPNIVFPYPIEIVTTPSGMISGGEI